MSSDPLAISTGLLFVYAEPGPNVPEQEFNDWYNVDHAPTRLTVPGIHNALRYKATDTLSPSYLALYDASTPTAFTTPPYTTLGSLATEREKTLVPQLANLNRSIFSLISTTFPPDAPSPPSEDAFPTPYVFIVTINVPSPLETDFNNWYETEHLALLSVIPGLVRIRRYKLQSNTQLAGSRGRDSGNGKPADPEYNYLALFDITREDFGVLPEFAKSVDTEWSKRLLPQLQNVTLRTFKLHTVVQKPSEA